MNRPSLVSRGRWIAASFLLSLAVPAAQASGLGGATGRALGSVLSRGVGGASGRQAGRVAGRQVGQTVSQGTGRSLAGRLFGRGGRIHTGIQRLLGRGATAGQAGSASRLGSRAGAPLPYDPGRHVGRIQATITPVNAGAQAVSPIPVQIMGSVDDAVRILRQQSPLTNTTGGIVRFQATGNGARNGIETVTGFVPVSASGSRAGSLLGLLGQ